MKAFTYQIIRLLLFGLGFGILNGLILGEIAGISWLLGYTLAWIFSPRLKKQEVIVWIVKI